MPCLISERLLGTSSVSLPFLHYFLKNPKRQDFKVTLRNKSRRMIAVDFMVLKNAELEEDYEVFIHPQTVTYSAGATYTTTMIFKQKTKGAKDKSKDKKGKVDEKKVKVEEKVVKVDPKKPRPSEYRVVILAKVKNSSAIFSFPGVISTRKNYPGKGRVA